MSHLFPPISVRMWKAFNHLAVGSFQSNVLVAMLWLLSRGESGHSKAEIRGMQSNPALHRAQTTCRSSLEQATCVTVKHTCLHTNRRRPRNTPKYTKMFGYMLLILNVMECVSVTFGFACFLVLQQASSAVADNAHYHVEHHGLEWGSQKYEQMIAANGVHTSTEELVSCPPQEACLSLYRRNALYQLMFSQR